jgi:hypothetical protein
LVFRVPRNHSKATCCQELRTTAVHLPDLLPRKEVIQPHLPVRLPCYDFVPVTSPALGGCILLVNIPTSGVTSSHDVTGGVYKARERIQRRVLIGVY